jgi:glucose-1-phosphate thymidylyltransferase
MSKNADSSRKGLILAGGAGSRLYPLTLGVSKQLMPVYDKPMIYYPLSVLMLAGIRDVLLISTPHDSPIFERVLGDGGRFGLRISYAVQPAPDGLPQAFLIGEEFLGGAPSALVLGDNLFYGAELGRVVTAAGGRMQGATIFGCEVSNPEAYGVLEFDAAGHPVGMEEKPAAPKSRWVIPGLYFFDGRAPSLCRTLKPSARGELEITDLIRLYLQEGTLQAIRFGRGTAWLDTGTHDSLLEAGHFVQTIQKRQGLSIACLEEIALMKGWISRGDIAAAASSLGASSYAKYLSELASRTPP